MATITGVAVGNANFSILVAALQYVDANVAETALVDTLNDPDASLTVFAPTNAAFSDLAADLGYTGDKADTDAVTNFIVGNVDAETIKTILLYHVAAGELSSADVTAATSVTSLQGSEIGVDLPTLVDLEPDLIDASLTALDVPADNGVIHIIDKVLLPLDLPGNDAPTITDIVAGSGDAFDDDASDFDVLLAAVKTAGLADTLADQDADFTVFAPTDQAFVDLANDLGFEGSAEADAWTFLVETLTTLGDGDPIPLLTEILTYHVAGESLQASQILGETELATLQGGTVTIDAATASLGDKDTDVADPTLITTDIQAANGVVHVIDKVLLPIDVPDVAGTMEEPMVETSSKNIFERLGDFIEGLFTSIIDLFKNLFGLDDDDDVAATPTVATSTTVLTAQSAVPTVDVDPEMPDMIDDDEEELTLM